MFIIIIFIIFFLNEHLFAVTADSPPLHPTSGIVSSNSVTNSSGSQPAGSDPFSTLSTTRALWVGEKKTLDQVTLDTGQPLTATPLEHLNDVAVDNHRGVVWVGTRKAIIQYDLFGKSLFTFTLKNHEKSKGEDDERGYEDRSYDRNSLHGEKGASDDDDHIHLSLDPSDGSLWVATGREIIKITDHRAHFRLVSKYPVSDLSVDIANGSCWVGSKHHIAHYASDGTPLRAFDLEEGNEVLALAADPSSHSLWIGSRKGLAKYDDQGRETIQIGEHLHIKDIEMNITSNALWVMTSKQVHQYSAEGQRLLVIDLCGSYDEAHSARYDQESEGTSDAEHTTKNNRNDVPGNASGSDRRCLSRCEGNLVTLAADSVDNTCWVAGGKTILKLNGVGDQLLQLGGFKQIEAVDIGIPKLWVTIAEPQEGSVFSEIPSILVRGTVTDPAAMVSVNGKRAVVTGLVFEASDILLADGINTITATATNPAHISISNSVQVDYRSIKGPALVLCGEPFREQRPKPPYPGCSQLLQDNWSWAILITGTVDDMNATVTVDDVLMPDGIEINDQGGIAWGKREGLFFWAWVYIPQVDGIYTFPIVAINDLGGKTVGNITFIRDTVPPGLVITSPMNGLVTRDQSVTITGTTNDPTAIIQFDWGAVIPTVNGAFSIQKDLLWGDRTYSFMISAVDPAGNASWGSVTIIHDTIPPQILIFNPIENSMVSSQTISVKGTLVDATPARVTVSVNNGQPLALALSGSSISGSLVLSPGTNTLLFEAHDGAGNTAVASRTVILDNEPPQISIAAPLPNERLSSQVTVSVTATDAMTGIESVSLLIDGKPQATVNQMPYEFVIDTLRFTSGAHTMAVRAADKVGNLSETSIPVTIEKHMHITIDSPNDGSAISRSSVVVRGRIDAGPNREAGVTVNGIFAHQYGGDFAAMVPLYTGQNTITVVISNEYGVTEQAAVSIGTNITDDDMRMIAVPNTGIPMTRSDGTTDFETSLQVDPSVTGSGLSYAWDTNGDGVTEDEGPTLSQVMARYRSPGIYSPTVTVSDMMGNRYTGSVIVSVVDRGAVDALLKTKWEIVKERLASQDIEGALVMFKTSSQDRYRDIFKTLKPKLSQMVQDMQEIQLIYLKDGRAKYRIRRGETYAGRLVTMTYYIYFALDENGIWKIVYF
jgi:predicted secreted protein